MKVVKSLDESCLLIKGVSKTFLIMLLGTLGASLLVNLWTGKCTIRAVEGAVRPGQDF